MGKENLLFSLMVFYFPWATQSMDGIGIDFQGVGKGWVGALTMLRFLLIP